MSDIISVSILTDEVYVSFDPGENSNIGIAVFESEKGQTIWYGQIRLQDIQPNLNIIAGRSKILAIICEDYRVFGHKARQHVGSRVETIQSIGVIKAFALGKHIPFVLQPSNILDIAQRLTQTKMPRDHSISHSVSAFLHGAYYLIQQGTRKTALQEMHEAEESDQVAQAAQDVSSHPQSTQKL